MNTKGNEHDEQLGIPGSRGHRHGGRIPVDHHHGRREELMDPFDPDEWDDELSAARHEWADFLIETGQIYQ